MEVEALLKRAGINLYMFHGGTNFGFYNGCSARGERDLPQVTSYDYDAVLTEWGEPTEKFYQIQKVVQKLFPENETFAPRTRRRVSYGEADLKGKVSLDSCVEALAGCRESVYPMTMEECGSGYGYMLYRTEVLGCGGEMKVKAIQTADRVQFYLNGRYQGTQYGDEIGEEILMKFEEGLNTLEILVENLGRVNYGYKLMSPSQKKGIRSGVMVDIHFESGWKNYALDLQDISAIDFEKEWMENTPAFYQYELDVQQPEDTFLDMRKFGKGVVFVNGKNLGRYWNKGPAGYLYVPGVWLKKGKNEIVVFETEGLYNTKLTFSDVPVYIEK